jgi:hypothetical protein
MRIGNLGVCTSVEINNPGIAYPFTLVAAKPGCDPISVTLHSEAEWNDVRNRWRFTQDARTGMQKSNQGWYFIGYYLPE